MLAALLFEERLNMAKKTALILCYGLVVVEFMKELLCWHTCHRWDGTGLGLGP